MKVSFDCGINKSEKTYPYIGIYHKFEDRELNLIVYFSEPNCGVVLYNNDTSTQKMNKVGTYKNNWIETYFSAFQGKITLEN